MTTACAGKQSRGPQRRSPGFQITDHQLSEALGVHYQTIGYLERGEFSPSLHLALSIAAYFDVPVEVVFSLKPFKRLTL